MGGPGAVLLALVFTGFRQQAGIAGRRNHGSGLQKLLGEPDGRTGRIDPHSLFLQPTQRRRQRVTIGEGHHVSEPGTVSSVTFAGSMNRSVAPSACTKAKLRAKGVNGTSPPRILSNQAIEAGSVSTAASCFASRSSFATSARFSSDARPAYTSGWG